MEETTNSYCLQVLLWLQANKAYHGFLHVAIPDSCKQRENHATQMLLTIA